MAIETMAYKLPDALKSDARLTALAPYLMPSPQDRGGISLPMMQWPKVAVWGQMLRIAAASKQLCIGLDALAEANISSGRPIALFSLDGAPRLYRNAATQMERQDLAFSLVDVGIEAATFGEIVHRKGSQIKFCVLIHDDAITKVMFALARALAA